MMKVKIQEQQSGNLQQEQVISIKRLLSVEEAAYALGIGRTFCYTLVMKRKIFSIKLGRNRLIPVTAIDKFVDEQIQEQEAC